jgi:hypothetical protein
MPLRRSQRVWAGQLVPKMTRMRGVSGDFGRFRLAFQQRRSYGRQRQEISAPAAVERPGAGTEAVTSMQRKRYSPLPPPGRHRGRLRCPTERRGAMRATTITISGAQRDEGEAGSA